MLDLVCEGGLPQGEKVDFGTDIIETDNRRCRKITIQLVFFHCFGSHFLDRVVWSQVDSPDPGNLKRA